MSNWRVAKSLIRLRDQINQAAPNRSKISDGSIGDARHQASKNSDHNPWVKDGTGSGVVTAIDVTHDPINGCDGQILSRAVTADPRVKYIIYNSEIWKARTKKWERYTGPNKHKQHVHISVQPDRYDNVAPWTLSVAPSAPVPPSRPVLKLGDKGQEVRVLQSRLRALGYSVSVDGNFGKITESVVRQFQEKHGLEVDGKVGPATYQKLG